MHKKMNSHEEDLRRTIQELSDSYEELSLIYRFSETIAGLDVDGICSKVVEEAVSCVNAETSAVLLLNNEPPKLTTHSFTGKWEDSLVIPWSDSTIWKAITKQKPIGIADISKSALSDIFPETRAVLLCPMKGKKKVIGLLIVADKTDGKEFFSDDIKLINTIAQQASLFIENAVLSREMKNFLIGTIQSFVKALEASSLWTAGHTERVTEYALAIGKELGLSSRLIERLRISCLLHDIGKIATPKEILNKPTELTEEEWHEIRRHPSIGAGILEGMEKFSDIIECIKYHHECYDGTKSVHGLKGEAIPLTSRILSVADAFDAMTSDRPYRTKKSVNEAVEEIQDFSGTQFDPEVVFAFTKWVDKQFNS